MVLYKNSKKIKQIKIKKRFRKHVKKTDNFYYKSFFKGTDVNFRA
jgi:hypothetical protein